MSIVLLLFLFLDFVSGAGREEKCSHRNSDGEQIGPDDLPETYCDQATTFVPAPSINPDGISVSCAERPPG